MSVPVFLCVTLGIACTVVGGVFLAFSDFIMRALTRIPATSGIEAMQQINRTVYRSVFLSSFLLLVPACIALMLWGWVRLPGDSAILISTGGGLYLLGAFATTAIANVPLNERLDGLPASTRQAQEFWAEYVQRWQRWNHLRTVAALGAGACLVLAAARLAMR